MLTDQLLGRRYSSPKHLILEVYTLESVLKIAVPHGRDVDVLQIQLFDYGRQWCSTGERWL
jgi:hypothetical protein